MNPMPRLPWSFRPGDAAETAWQFLRADVADVTAAIESMCEPYRLQAQGTSDPRHWYHQTSDLGRGVHVTIHACGQETLIGVHFQSATDLHSYNLKLEGMIFLAIGGSLGLLALEGREVGAILGILLLEFAYWLIFVIFFQWLPHRRRRRRLAWWSHVWRRSFWVALEARLVPGRIYR